MQACRGERSTNLGLVMLPGVSACRPHAVSKGVCEARLFMATGGAYYQQLMRRGKMERPRRQQTRGQMPTTPASRNLKVASAA